MKILVKKKVLKNKTVFYTQNIILVLSLEKV